jgi:acyl carrier protein
MTDQVNDQDILATLSRILGDLLEDPSIRLTAATTRPDVPRWDSFAYVTFIVAVESEFGIRFRLADVDSFRTVGDIVNEIKALRR